MEKQKKKQIKKYISWLLILSLVLLLAALPAIVSKEEAGELQASILSAKAENRDITAAVLGGGTVATDEAVAITIPAQVKIKEYLVGNGDTVTKGQTIATVDRVSVMEAVTQVQETLEYLREELRDARDETQPTKVTAIANGTVKTVYAAEDENVQDVMLRDGALAVISLDGLMAVQVQRSTKLSAGDTVCVTLADGTELTGTVESNLDGLLTVTVEDDGYEVGQKVHVTTEDGGKLGSGTLYVHSPWNVVAYSGTVSRVRIKDNSPVYTGQILFNLENTGYTAQFDALSAQHREYEALMLELFQLYQNEAVTAPADGMITGVDEEGAYMLSDTGGGWKVTFLANGPGGDENTYTNYVGQVTEVGIDGLVMKMNPQAIAVEDYFDLSGVPLNTELMTESTTYIGGAPIYVLTDGTAEEGTDPGTAAPSDPSTPKDPSSGTETNPGTGTGTQPNPDSGTGTQPDPGSGTENQATKQWVQLSPYSVAAGDILLFAGNSSGVVWVIRVGHTDLPQGSDKPTQTPGADTQQPSGPSGNLPQGGGMPSMGGGMPGGGGMGQEESEELYALDTVTIASVTEQETAHIQITVDELDVLKLYVGQAAEVTVGALQGQQFAGTVTSISADGENGGGNSKFTVEVTLDKIPDMLPGMRAAVSVALDTAEQAVCIPVAALIENGTETVVYKGYNEETEEFTDPVAVTTGASDGEYVQILSGIVEGETVYYPYYDTLVISDTPEAVGFSFG